MSAERQESQDSGVARQRRRVDTGAGAPVRGRRRALRPVPTAADQGRWDAETTPETAEEGRHGLGDRYWEDERPPHWA